MRYYFYRYLQLTLWQLIKYFLITIAVTFLLFSLLRLMPLDPTAMAQSPTATTEDIAKLKQYLLLDKPLLTQYGIWLRNLLHGDIGNAIQTGKPVADTLRETLPVTAILIFMALLSAIIHGIFIALIAFLLRRKCVIIFIDTINNLCISIPAFLWALLLIFFLGIYANFFPFFGLVSPGMTLDSGNTPLINKIITSNRPEIWFNSLLHFILPCYALSLTLIPVIVKNTFNQLSAVFQHDYISYAKLRGISTTRILLFHALPNALPPVIALISVQASMLVGGTLLVENIFGLPGSGMMMLKAIATQDLPLIQGIALCYAIAVIFIQAVTHLLLYFLTPYSRKQ
ncbi:ABC transporter permease [Tenebrionicola larvae]|uniref:ABC transporter permease n=1 Tax=Tenebrionicola larvae TaxID=2815733 RepID=UPI002010C771|nr:ABC transporter permease [Tenebrionicola larvae]